jgi:hypothetical protein
MGVKDTMNNFFTSMSGKMASGSGQKSITTPMGPFTWDDNLQMWVNTNNGMVMSNIAFQDQFAMMDYDVTNETGVASLYDALTLSPTTWGNFSGGRAAQSFWCSSAVPGATTLINSANNVRFTFVEGTPTITVSITKIITVDSGGQPTLIYSKNGGAQTNYSTPITMTTGDTLKVGLSTGVLAEGMGTITITNNTTGNVLGTINGEYAP